MMTFVHWWLKWDKNLFNYNRFFKYGSFPIRRGVIIKGNLNFWNERTFLYKKGDWGRNLL